MIYREYLKAKNQNSIKFKEVEGPSPLSIFHSKGRDLKNYQIYGNSTQKTTGKNMLPYPFADTTRTIYGITFTDNKDGTITLNGTSTFSTTTSIADFYLCRNISISAGTYTLSGCPSGGSTYKYRLMMSIKKSGGTTAYSSDIGQGYSFTVDTDATVTLTIRIGGEIGTVSNLVFKPQLEKGSTATEYEAYHTSPSPEFPSEVESVGDLTTKNLINESAITLSSGYWSDSGGNQINNNSGFIRISSVKCNPNETYTLSSNLKIYTIWFFNNDTSISKTYRENTVAAFTTPENCNRLRISLVNTSGNIDTIAFKWIQLELGSTATAYEPYHKYDVPVTVMGKNLCTSQQAFYSELTDYGYTNTTLDDRNCVRFIDCVNVRNSPIEFEENTQYTVQFYCKVVLKGTSTNTEPDNVFTFFYTDGTSSKISINANQRGKWIKKTLTSTAEKTIKYIGISTTNYVCYCYIDMDTFQLEKGSPATEYEPYIPPVTKHIYLDEPLRKIGDNADYIDFKNQKVVRCIVEITLDGTENWVYQESKNIIYLSIKNKNLSRTFDSFSTHFLFQDSRNAIDPYFVVVNTSTLGNVVLRFNQQGDNIIYSTADEFKTFLVDQYNSGNPVKLLCNCYNVVETAVTIPNLTAPKSEKATIMVDTSIKPSNMKIKYIRM